MAIQYTQTIHLDPELQKKLRKIARRNRYIKEIETENETIRLGESADLVADAYDLAEDVETRIRNEKLYAALDTLNADELELICQIYFKGLSLRQYAKSKEIAVSTCHARKEKIFKKLRNLLQNNDI